MKGSPRVEDRVRGSTPRVGGVPEQEQVEPFVVVLA